MISLLLLTAFAWSSPLPGEELYSAPEKKVTVSTESPLAVAQPVGKKAKSVEVRGGNLPSAYRMSLGRESTKSALLMPKNNGLELFNGLGVGESIEAVVRHSIIAFPDEKVPVVAVVEGGALRGVKFIGESYLEKNSRRIFIEFNRAVRNKKVYTFKGIGLSESGQPGFIGKYHSREFEYFSGDFISSFVAGYFDGLIPRRNGPFGQYEADNSLDSAVKKGLSSGALSSAERFREKLKSTPEFAELKGSLEVNILSLK